jgi:hypothetical protein
MISMGRAGRPQSNATIPKAGSLLDRVGTRIYQWWLGFRDRTGAFRKSDSAEGVAATRFQSRRIYLHTIWQEVCNAPRRIAILHANRLHRCGIGLQTISGRSHPPHRQRCRYRQIRRRGIQLLLSIHPEATLVDLCLVNRLAMSGEDCRMEAENPRGEDNLDCGKMRMEPHTNSCPSQSHT